MTHNLTAVTVFSKATLAALRLAETATTSKQFSEAQVAAVANARALWRAALMVPPPYEVRKALREATLAVGRAS